MAELDHWHPVLRSEDLGRRPAPVRLAGRELVLFRGEDGAVGALPDRCPHRGMRLSLGKVEDGRLVCPYHGWAWATDGSGRSPGNPRAKPRAECLDVVERHGAVWVKNAASTAPFPVVETSGWHEVARLRHRVKAPLVPVLDNFIEVEHTGVVHALLGYETSRMDEVEVRVEATDDAVRVENRGPQRPLPRLLRRLFRIEEGDLFVDDWTTRFSPVHTVYDHYWLDARTGERRPDMLRLAVFMNPVDATETELFTFGYINQPPWSRLGLTGLLGPLTSRLIDMEIRRDRRMIERLADHGEELRGNALGRFDKPLAAARKRLDRIYRGVQP